MYRTTGLPNSRIQVADTLRGIAVAGIILIHACEHFNLYWSGIPFDRALVDGWEEPSSASYGGSSPGKCTPSSPCSSG